MLARFIYIVLLFAFPVCCFAQGDAMKDSLLRDFLAQKEIAARVNTLNVLNKSLRARSEYNEALEYARAAIRLSAAGRDSQGNSVAWHNYGITQFQIGNYAEALRAYFITLKMREAMSDSLGLAKTYGNIGSVYFEQKDYAQALLYQARALEIDKKLGNKKSQAITTGNMGSAYLAANRLEEASAYCEEALALCNEIGHKPGIANNLGNIGVIYELRKDLTRALEYYKKAALIDKGLGNRDGVARHLVNMAHTELLLQHYMDAGRHLDTATRISYETGSLESIADAEKTYSILDSARGKFPEALRHYKRYVSFRDSIANEENTRKQTRLEMQYEFDKKEEAGRIDQERKNVLAEADKKKQNIILTSVAGVGLLVLVFALFAWRSYLEKKKANVEISTQKRLIEEKQKEILDSIHYARRIQASLMPHEKQVHKELRRLMKNN